MSSDRSDRDTQQTLAEERTSLAYTRTLLAEQRTYSAWMRTGLAAVATGFAIDKLMNQNDPAWLTNVLGFLFIVSGGTMFVFAFWSYRNALKQMPESSIRGAPLWIIAGLSVALTLGAIAALALVIWGEVG